MLNIKNKNVQCVNCVNRRQRDDGVAPVHIALHGGHVDVVTALIDAGTDVNLAPKSGATAPSIASQGAHTLVVAALIPANASTYRMNLRANRPSSSQLTAAIWRWRRSRQGRRRCQSGGPRRRFSSTGGRAGQSPECGPSPCERRGKPQSRGSDRQNSSICRRVVFSAPYFCAAT